MTFAADLCPDAITKPMTPATLHHQMQSMLRYELTSLTPGILQHIKGDLGRVRAWMDDGPSTDWYWPFALKHFVFFHFLDGPNRTELHILLPFMDMAFYPFWPFACTSNTLSSGTVHEIISGTHISVWGPCTTWHGFARESFAAAHFFGHCFRLPLSVGLRCNCISYIFSFVFLSL